MTKMKKASQLFSTEQISAIEATIADVEKNTSAEIVPVVASVSGRYDRAEDLFAFLFALLTVGIAWPWILDLAPVRDSWGNAPGYGLQLTVVVLSLAVSFIIGIALASHFPVLRSPLIPRSEIQEEVQRSARETFQRLKIRGTENATGVLIYVSLYEHMVYVVGDDSINAKLNQDAWQLICDTIIDGFKDGKPEQGLRNGILRCGEMLAEHFPIQQADSNELSNTLHLID